MRTVLSVRPATLRWPEAAFAQQNVPLTIYVSGVIAGGAALLVYMAPRSLARPMFAVSVLTAAIVLSLFKVRLPLHKGVSTMTLAYAADLVALLAGDPNLAMLISAAAVLVQCTTRVRRSQPFYRTMFSMAAVVVSVRAAGAVW